MVLDVEASGAPLGAAFCVGDFVSTDPEVVALFDLTFIEGRDPTEEEFAVLDQAYEEGFDACGV